MNVINPKMKAAHAPLACIKNLLTVISVFVFNFQLRRNNYLDGSIDGSHIKIDGSDADGVH